MINTKIDFYCNTIIIITMIFTSCGVINKSNTSRVKAFTGEINYPTNNKTGSDIGSFHPNSIFDLYKLVCREEFNSTSIDTNLWRFDNDSSGNNNGWGNSELQYYTTKSDNNAYIENSALVIEAKNESKSGKSYTSARLHTHGTLKVKYGIIEARIKLPANSSSQTDPGTWPAFWMLGDSFNGWGHSVFGGSLAWPLSGEIDIMESNHSSFGYSKIQGALHWQDEHVYSVAYQSTEISNPTNEYHIYSIFWTPTEIQFYLDYKKYYSYIFTQFQTEFNEPFFILLNLAVGGKFPSTPITSNYPQKMYIDWIRIYQ